MTCCFMMTILSLDILNHSYVKDKLITINSQGDNERPIKYENIEQQWAQIQSKMLSNGFELVHEFNSSYGESSFETICYLTRDEYDVPCLRRIMAQTFSNVVMHNDYFAIRCINQYIKIDIQQGLPRVIDWKTYIENLALPYEKGNIEGRLFTYDWIAYIWDIEIHIWFSETTTMLTIFHSIREASRIFNVIQF
jgi:hypothetical protein